MISKVIIPHLFSEFQLVFSKLRVTAPMTAPHTRPIHLFDVTTPARP
jgi:hypothetical protein